MKPMLSRTVHEAVYEPKVEVALLGLDQLPRDTSQGGVDILLREAIPDRIHILQARGAGIEQFAPKDQERLPIHDQLNCGAMGTQARSALHGIATCGDD